MHAVRFFLPRFLFCSFFVIIPFVFGTTTPIYNNTKKTKTTRIYVKSATIRFRIVHNLRKSNVPYLQQKLNENFYHFHLIKLELVWCFNDLLSFYISIVFSLSLCFSSVYFSFNLFCFHFCHSLFLSIVVECISMVI